MFQRSRSVAALVLFAAWLSAEAAWVEAAELRIYSASGLRAVVDNLGSRFERTTGHNVSTTYGAAGIVAKRIRGGVPADIVLLPRPAAESLLTDRTATEGIDVASSGVGVAMRKGGQKPDISSADALRRALLAAKSITYSDPSLGGASGIHFGKVLERLGIAGAVKAKTYFPPRDSSVGQVIESGEAEIGVHQLQELARFRELEIIGPLPGELQATIIFTALVMSAAGNAQAANMFIEFLRSEEAITVMRANGMAPMHQ